MLNSSCFLTPCCIFSITVASSRLSTTRDTRRRYPVTHHWDSFLEPIPNMSSRLFKRRQPPLLRLPLTDLLRFLVIIMIIVSRSRLNCTIAYWFVAINVPLALTNLFIISLSISLTSHSNKRFSCSFIDMNNFSMSPYPPVLSVNHNRLFALVPTHH